jgi:futalosine hydrolase
LKAGDKLLDAKRTNRRILIITAVDAERDAVLRGIRAGIGGGGDVGAGESTQEGDCSDGCGRFTVLAAGVGPIAAAAGTAIALTRAAGSGSGAGDSVLPPAQSPQAADADVAACQSGTAGGFRLAVSAGIGGGFAGRAEVGSLVVASELIAADLGVRSPAGFASVDELGFGSSRLLADPDLAGRVAACLQAAGFAACLAPALTVSTATGTAATADELAARYPTAACEAMEGFGVAEAARRCGLPFLEIRAISNAIGPRDRDAWRIPDALRALEQAFAILTEVL